MERLATTEETVRLAVLESYEVLDTFPEKELDALTQLAASICDMPVALISLLDKDRQWFKSAFGLQITETAREVSFCHYTIKNNSLLEIADAGTDARFNNNPYVTGDPYIRYYCGVPLTSPEGFNIGSLCVLDHSPAHLTEKQKMALQTLAGEVMARLELRRQKKQLEAEKKKLAASEKRYKALVENSEGYIFTHDLQGKLLSVNPKMAKALNYTPEQLSGKSLAALLISEEPAFKDYLQQIEAMGVVNGIMRIKTTHHQERFWVYRNFKYTDDEGKCYVICSAHDTTDKEIAKQLLEKAKNELEIKVQSRTKQLLALNNALTKTKTNLDTFVYRASHDLLGPLCSLKGLLNIARQDEDPDNQEEYLDLMYHTVEKLENILNSLLSYSNNSHYSLQCKPVDFQKIINDSIQACTHIDFYKRIQFQTSIRSTVPFWSDADRLTAVLRCLISNSIVFQNFYCLISYVQINISSDTNKAIITVKDNGIGIPDPIKPTIFDLFAKSALYSKGAGLGLFIVKEVLSKLNGTVEVSSTEGEGTIFTIEIPNGKRKDDTIRGEAG
jgi:PAS domain S-box-containing protein